MRLYMIYTFSLTHIQITSLSSYHEYKLNSLMTYSQQGFIAQVVEHCTGIAEVMGSIEYRWSLNFFWPFFATALVAS